MFWVSGLFIFLNYKLRTPNSKLTDCGSKRNIQKGKEDRDQDKRIVEPDLFGALSQQLQRERHGIQ